MRLKKVAMVLSAALGVALAQGQLFGEVLFGQASFIPNFALLVSLRGGTTQALGPLDLRVGGQVDSAAGTTIFTLNADALYPLPVDVQTGRLDAGLGVYVNATPSLTTFGLRGLVGYEVPVQGALALRVEPTLTYDFNAQQLGLGLTVGPRIYLR
ncbi:hypothetical protein [Thermus oshimai]|uniref:hypothetical protein n=1 Tax=Thermus oshimai TaxID=56957 RepID=UPI0031FBA2FC